MAKALVAEVIEHKPQKAKMWSADTMEDIYKKYLQYNIMLRMERGHYYTFIHPDDKESYRNWYDSLHPEIIKDFMKQ